MEAPPFWAHNGARYMAKNHRVMLGWRTDSQSFEKLKGKVAKASDTGLGLSGGGRAPMYANVDAVWRSFVASMREEATTKMAQQKAALLPAVQVPIFL